MSISPVDTRLIGIVAALPIEARMISRKNPDRLLLRIAGMGAISAQRAAQDLISRGVTALISWGTVAGLAPELRPGQLLLPDKIITQDHAAYPVTSSWRHQLQQSLAARVSIVNGCLLQVDQIIASVQDKRRLFTQYQAVAADMESAAIAAAAQQANIPFLAIRGIVDAADFTFPAWLLASLDSRGVVQPFSLMKKLCRRPGRLFTLLQLARDFSAARRALTIAAAVLER